MAMAEKIVFDQSATRPVTDLSVEPLILFIEDMVRLRFGGVGTIRRKVQDGTFEPMPYDKRPYRWLRADVEAFFDRKASEPRVSATREPVIRPRVPTGRPRGRPSPRSKRRH